MSTTVNQNLTNATIQANNGSKTIVEGLSLGFSPDQGYFAIAGFITGFYLTIFFALFLVYSVIRFYINKSCVGCKDVKDIKEKIKLQDKDLKDIKEKIKLQDYNLKQYSIELSSIKNKLDQ